MELSPILFREPEWPLYLPPNDEDLGGGDGTLGVVRYDKFEPSFTLSRESEWPLYLPLYNGTLGSGDETLGVVRCVAWFTPAVESYDEKRD